MYLQNKIKRKSVECI